MKLEFESWHSKKDIKEWQSIWKNRQMPRSMQESIDTRKAEINGTIAFEIQKKGIRKVKYILFVHEFGIISSMGSRLGGGKLRKGEYTTSEDAEKAAQDHIDKFIESLN